MLKARTKSKYMKHIFSSAKILTKTGSKIATKMKINSKMPKTYTHTMYIILEK